MWIYFVWYAWSQMDCYWDESTLVQHYSSSPSWVSSTVASTTTKGGGEKPKEEDDNGNNNNNDDDEEKEGTEKMYSSVFQSLGYSKNNKNNSPQGITGAGMRNSSRNIKNGDNGDDEKDHQMGVVVDGNDGEATTTSCLLWENDKWNRTMNNNTFSEEEAWDQWEEQVKRARNDDDAMVDTNDNCTNSTIHGDGSMWDSFNSHIHTSSSSRSSNIRSWSDISTNGGTANDTTTSSCKKMKIMMTTDDDDPMMMMVCTDDDQNSSNNKQEQQQQQSNAPATNTDRKSVV